ncbi:hypothetical protein WKV44_01470 [Spirochaetia bacterium 38H-sp]|uniref:Serine active site containing 1-like protein n=1 Tax=Rarispira pelagica TaxID=3141764 RepID=A0ABU9U957_9SPIR
MAKIKENKFFIAGFVIYGVIAFIVWFLGSRLESIEHLSDKGASWYYWQLPEPGLISRISAWTGYTLHQLSIWVLAFFAIKADQKEKKEKVVKWIFISNIFFVILHLIQTHLFYDGLAQDVPIWSSQYSVIIMLIILLFMLEGRRGLFFGKKIGIKDKLRKPVRKWHGIYISWALVYTFWFHPMEGSYGLLAGFIYMFLLFIQTSMVGKPIHTSTTWVALLETFVALHAFAIATYKGQEIWPMFVTGFLFMAVMTYQYGIKLPSWVYKLNWIVYIALVAVLYYQRGYSKLYEVSFIPVALYGGALGLWFLMFILSKIFPSAFDNINDRGERI